MPLSAYRVIPFVIGMLVALLSWQPATAAAAKRLDLVELAAPAPGQFGAPPSDIVRSQDSRGWRAALLPLVIRGDPAADRNDTRVTRHILRAAIDLPVSTQATFLYIPRWQTVGHIAIFADGRLVYAPRSGPFWNSFNLPVWVRLADAGKPPPRELLIRIDSSRGWDVAVSSLWLVQVGAPEFSAALFLVMGLATLLIWAQRRDEKIYLWIFGVAALEFLHSREYFVGLEPISISDGLFQWMELNTKIWYLVFTFLITSEVIGVRWRRAERAIFAGALLFSIGTLGYVIDGMSSNRVMPNLWLPPVLLVGVVAGLSWAGLRRKFSRMGLALCVFTTLLIPAGLYDLAMTNFVVSIEGVYLLPIVAIIQMTLFFGVLVNRHLASLRVAETARADLAMNLAAREAELATSYQLLRESERRATLEQERQRLMRDMHDGIGSSLIGAVAAVERGQMTEAQLADLLRECIDDLKLVIDSLEPGETDLMLLLATVRYRLEPRFDAAGIRLVWSVGEAACLASIGPDAALHVLRIFQEIFTNIIRHSQAQTVFVSIFAAADKTTITIEDDGIGFDVAASPLCHDQLNRGRGLGNLRTRSRLLSASLACESGTGSTKYTLQFGASPGC
jgi:signal transduction histidine kinase